MKKIFISYGDDAFAKSLKRIGKEAKALGIFNKIILYKPADLPHYILDSPLMAFKKGGGYWLWKPYIIWKTLQQYNNNAIIVYADAGCTLFPSNDWKMYFEQMNTFDTLVFRYRSDIDYGWKQAFGNGSPQVKFWTKKNTLMYFNHLLNKSSWENENKIWGGFIISKNVNNQLVDQWFKLSLMEPQLIMDPYGAELEDQYEFFIEHRHDQSLLTPLAYYFSEINHTVSILDETAESGAIDHCLSLPVLADRKRDDRMTKVTLKTRMIHFVQSIIGIKLYRFLHG